MAYFRLNLFVLLFVVAVFPLHGQKNPVLYGGLELFRHTGFESNSFGNFNVGSQLYHWKFIAPEVGLSHYRGTLREQDIFNEPRPYTIAPALLQKNFNANFFTVTPKIKIGKEDAFISFSPNYHVGTINAIGRYYELDGSRYLLEERQKRSAPVSFWSFSLGVEGLAVQEEKYWFTLFLIYTEVDANAALSKLNFSQYDIDTFGENTTTIGLGIRIYYNPFPVKED